MEKQLTNVSRRLRGELAGIWGNAKNIYGLVLSGLTGNVTRLIGYVSNIFGKVSPDLFGDVSELSGDISGLTGDATGTSGCATGYYGDITNVKGSLSYYDSAPNNDTTQPLVPRSRFVNREYHFTSKMEPKW